LLPLCRFWPTTALRFDVTHLRLKASRELKTVQLDDYRAAGRVEVRVTIAK
jgi:hypothetical protein